MHGDGWRLPTVEELQTIVDETQARSPTIDGAAFPNTPPTRFWSSSPKADDDHDAWYVAFNVDGTEFTGGYSAWTLQDDELRVRCVH